MDAPQKPYSIDFRIGKDGAIEYNIIRSPGGPGCRDLMTDFNRNIGGEEDWGATEDMQKCSQADPLFAEEGPQVEQASI